MHNGGRPQEVSDGIRGIGRLLAGTTASKDHEVQQQNMKQADELLAGTILISQVDEKHFPCNLRKLELS
jgi:hypothetical protein